MGLLIDPKVVWYGRDLLWGQIHGFCRSDHIAFHWSSVRTARKGNLVSLSGCMISEALQVTMQKPLTAEASH